MALIKCPNCGKDYSQFANKCPRCGLTIEEAERAVLKKQAEEEKRRWLIAKNRKRVLRLVGLTVLSVVVLFGAYWGIKEVIKTNTAKTRVKDIPFIYDDALTFSEGLAPVKKDGKWGCVDKTGKEVVPPIYDGARGGEDGLAAVKKDGKWGFIRY